MHCVTSRSQQWQTIWIALWMASTPALFSRFGPQRLLSFCRPLKNAPGKEIWFQWRSDIRKWGVFWDQRQIVLQKRHQIVRVALESVYHPRKRLLMNKVKFCLKVVDELVELTQLLLGRNFILSDISDLTIIKENNWFLCASKTLKF